MAQQVYRKRIYQAAAKGDGKRVLIERLWPRGVSKTAAAVDIWLREIAPTPELRKWFGHDPTRWQEFQRRYRKELDDNPEVVDQLLALAARHVVTLVYAARDGPGNSAMVLQAYLQERLQHA